MFVLIANLSMVTPDARAGTTDTVGTVAPPESKRNFKLFSEFGIGFRIGGTFLEKAVADAFDGLVTLGTEVEVDVFSYNDSHFLIIPASYMSPMPHLRSGSEQILLETQYRIVDIGLKYNYLWSFFTAGTGVGLSMMVVTSTARYYDLLEPGLDIGDPEDPYDDQTVFRQKRIQTVEDHTGTILGPYFNLELGVDLGRLMGGRERFFEMKGTAQYARRKARNELYTWMTLSIRPSALWRKKK